MMKKVCNTPDATPVLATGQVWQYKDGRVLVGLVGKTLVHYKLYRPDEKRPPVQLARQQQLRSFLQKNRAVLLKEPTEVPAQAGEKQLQAGRGMFVRRPRRHLSQFAYEPTLSLLSPVAAPISKKWKDPCPGGARTG